MCDYNQVQASSVGLTLRWLYLLQRGKISTPNRDVLYMTLNYIWCIDLPVD